MKLLLELQQLLEENIPQEIDRKPPAEQAKLLAPMLKKAGIELIQANPIKSQKNALWSVKSSKYPAPLQAVICLNARSPGGRGVNKPRMLNLSFSVFDEDGQYVNGKHKWVAALSFEGAGKIYKERIK